MSENNLQMRVDRLDNAVFGDRDNPKGSPGVIADQVKLSIALDRTNELLTEVRNAVLWIVGIVMTSFLTALIALVYKGHP